MALECPLCVRACSRDHYARYHIGFVLAKLNDEPEPECGLFELSTYRGLEGVADLGFVSSEPLFERGERR